MYYVAIGSFATIIADQVVVSLLTGMTTDTCLFPRGPGNLNSL